MLLKMIACEGHHSFARERGRVELRGKHALGEVICQRKARRSVAFALVGEGVPTGRAKADDTTRAWGCILKHSVFGEDEACEQRYSPSNVVVSQQLRRKMRKRLQPLLHPLHQDRVILKDAFMSFAETKDLPATDTVSRRETSIFSVLTCIRVDLCQRFL